MTSKLDKQQAFLMTIVRDVIPEEVYKLEDVQYPKILFDPAHAAAGLTVDEGYGSVTQTASNTWGRSVYAKEGFTSGRKYWSFKIIRKGSDYLAFGISDGTVIVTKSDWPGHEHDPGFSLNVYNGYTYYKNKRSQLPTNAATRIGFLLDMNEKTVTCYADGELAGTMGADVLTAGTYYPVVVLTQKDQKVQVEEVPYPLVSTGTK